MGTVVLLVSLAHLALGAGPIHGTGYAPVSATVSYRPNPGGSCVSTHPDLTVDPWALNQARYGSPEPLHLEDPTIAAALRRRYGFPASSAWVSPPGGWCGALYVPGNETGYIWRDSLTGLCQFPDYAPGVVSGTQATHDCQATDKEIWDGKAMGCSSAALCAPYRWDLAVCQRGGPCARERAELVSRDDAILIKRSGASYQYLRADSQPCGIFQGNNPRWGYTVFWDNRAPHCVGAHLPDPVCPGDPRCPMVCPGDPRCPMVCPGDPRCPLEPPVPRPGTGHRISDVRVRLTLDFPPAAGECEGPFTWIREGNRVIVTCGGNP